MDLRAAAAQKEKERRKTIRIASLATTTQYDFPDHASPFGLTQTPDDNPAGEGSEQALTQSQGSVGPQFNASQSRTVTSNLPPRRSTLFFPSSPSSREASRSRSPTPLSRDQHLGHHDHTPRRSRSRTRRQLQHSSRSQSHSHRRRRYSTPPCSRSRSPHTPRHRTRENPDVPFTPFKTKRIDPQKPRERDLSPISQSLIPLAKRYFRIRLATVDLYPSDVQVVSWIKGSVHQACTEKNIPRRYERYTHDATYSKYMFKLIKQKMSQLRNDIKDIVLASVLPAYGLLLTMSREEISKRIGFLTKQYGFAFENPDERTGLCRHPIFYTVAMGLWFSSPTDDAIKCSQSFNPFPVPTLALIGTAVLYALRCYSSGRLEVTKFEADKNVEEYQKLMGYLMEWKEKNPAALADVQYTLWRKLWYASGYAPITEEDNVRELDDRDFGIVPRDVPPADVTHAASNGLTEASE
ncbi:hypothetical protein NLI96_g4504 [Meripilus lineatus]|uniref:DUF6532 domain-containing protein n=1 Tax=Meripilus lineatus TaxID=2056292 RepID=A0AAD5YK26_9APHY|nr:hypothetical protein NLI96_g4504 [Physisporinus lineatus]